jgi:hypothetical protein
MEVVDEALNYERLIHTYGTYQHTKIVQNSGVQVQQIDISGGNKSSFELPTEVYNLSKSYLQFQLVPNTAVANNSYYFYPTNGYASIRQMQLQSRTGDWLCDINDFDRFTDMTFRRSFLNTDVLTWDNPNGTLGTGYFEGLTPSNSAIATNYRPDGTTATTNYLESKYILSGLTNATSPVVNVRIDFSKLKDTILGENKDLFFGQILVLKIIWNTPSKILFINTAAANTTPRHTATPYAGSMTVNNLLLYLAMEVDPMLRNKMKAQAASNDGIQVLFPTVCYNKASLNSSTVQNVTGRKLKKIYWAPYNNLESGFTTFDHSNIPGLTSFTDTIANLYAMPFYTKVTSFYTNINNIKTSQSDYICANGDDWMAMRDKLRGSI